MVQHPAQARARAEAIPSPTNLPTGTTRKRVLHAGRQNTIPTPSGIQNPLSSTSAQLGGSSSVSASVSDAGSSQSGSSSQSSIDSSTPSSGSQSASSAPDSTPPSSVSSTPSSTPPSSSSSPPSSSTPSSSSSTLSSSSSSTSLSTPLSSSTTSSAQPSSSLPPTSSEQSNTSSSSSSAQTTITSTIVTNIGGVETTITTAIPTTLSSEPASSTISSQTRAIIAGCAIGGVALLAILVALFMFCKRSNNKKFRVFGREKSRSMLLAGEDFDDADPPSQPYRDYPPSSRTPSLGGQTPMATTPSADMHGVMFPRAGTPQSGRPSVVHQDSGSRFHEGISPPPTEVIRLDPYSIPPGNNLYPPTALSSQDASHIRVDSTTSIFNSSDPFRSPNQPQNISHSRDTSQTPLLSNRDSSASSGMGLGLGLGHSASLSMDSTMTYPAPRAAPLFVANAGPESPTSPLPPPTVPLAVVGSPPRVQMPLAGGAADTYPMGEAM